MPFILWKYICLYSNVKHENEKINRHFKGFLNNLASSTVLAPRQKHAMHWHVTCEGFAAMYQVTKRDCYLQNIEFLPWKVLCTQAKVSCFWTLYILGHKLQCDRKQTHYYISCIYTVHLTRSHNWQTNTCTLLIFIY